MWIWCLYWLLCLSLWQNRTLNKSKSVCSLMGSSFTEATADEQAADEQAACQQREPVKECPSRLKADWRWEVGVGGLTFQRFSLSNLLLAARPCFTKAPLKPTGKCPRTRACGRHCKGKVVSSKRHEEPLLPLAMRRPRDAIYGLASPYQTPSFSLLLIEKNVNNGIL